MDIYALCGSYLCPFISLLNNNKLIDY